MTCASCGHANPERAKFCLECGAALAARCARCATELPPGAKFCLECGAPAATPSAEPTGRRKVVTIVFADLVGSTALHERLDAESARRFMQSYYRAMRGAVEAHGGTVTQLLGDGVKAVFGMPRVAEDDAIRAVRAAVEMQRAFHTLAEQRSDAVGKTGLRIAVNTGEVVATDESEIIGDPVNVAARLQEQGRDGDVVLGESTQRLVAALVTLELLGSFALKGRSEAVKAYRVVSLERPVGAAAVAFVGRDAELARINAVYHTSLEKPAASLAVLLGSPGLGKSRLIDEFVRRLGDAASVFSAHCDAAGGASFAPLAVALRQGLGIEAGASGDALRASVEASLPGTDVERARIVAGITSLLAGSPASPEETFFVVRRLLASLAATRPVVLVIDDLHWAEPLLLDLVEHLVQWGSGVPLLVLVGARPELRDVRSSLATPGGLVADVMTLAGLDAGAAMRLAASVIGAADLPAAVAVKVLAASEGNPLFVGELVRMLVHEGALKKEGDRWTTGIALAALEMPPTIQALLAARIERLRPEERTVLERAAVVGRQFSRTAVAQLLPREISDLDARLEALRRHELIESDTGWLLGEPVLRFHHVLIRDAAYRRVLKETRADLHARLADWIEARAGESIEQDETIGWHLEQAHLHLRELGPIDERGRALGERASRRLAAAGRRALARDDVPLAAGLLGRALDRLDAANPARADLALDWCEALLSAGEVGPAAGAIEELGRFSAGSDRLRAWHTCFKGELAALTDPEALRETADAVAAAAGELAAVGDAAGEAKAHAVHALALSRLGRVGASEAALDRALAAARRVDDRRRVNAVLAGAPLAALWGPSPVTRASGRCLDVVRVLRITQGAPAVEAVALRCQGVLEALRGRADAARRMIASSRRMVEELGLTQGLLETEVSAGLVELIEGDFEAAERSLRKAYEGLRAHGLGIDAARAAGLLGRTLLSQGRAAEAEALSHESEALAGDDLQAAITWRRVRAEALARRGEHASAIDFARAAVEIAAATDNLLHHADARRALAVALRAAGRADEADAEEARAVELWLAKGATLPAERARLGAVGVEAAALARADSGEAAHFTSRRVRANAATANLARLDAAIAARDADALPALFAAEMQVPTHRLAGGANGRQGVLGAWRSLLAAEAPRCRHEPLATLGDSLVLCRLSTSASGFTGRTFDVGAYERVAIALIEVDPNGRQRWSESFEADKLGPAIVRLYELYAERPRDVPERIRAAATARSVAALMGSPEHWPFAPDADATDHRTVGFGSLRGAEAVARAIRALVQLSNDWAFRIDDVLDLRPDALLVRWTTSGTLRDTGGAFERVGDMLWLIGADGLITRWEQFDVEQDADALARFDALTAGPPAERPIRRRVRPNAAIANVRDVEAAVAARNADAFEGLIANDATSLNHTTGAEMDRPQILRAWRSFLTAEDFTLAVEPLGTLGDALVLCRQYTSASGVARGDVDVGAYDNESILLVEVDAEGRRRWTEYFAPRRLGDAIARLYERYSELLPDGPERARASAIARSFSAGIAPDAAIYAADVEFIDHRKLGFGSVRGADGFLRIRQSLHEVASDSTDRIDDVLGLRPDARLVPITNLGTDRSTGGAFERHFLRLTIHGADGLVTRVEQFDVEQEAEALARFDALTAEPPTPRGVQRHVRANAATLHLERMGAAIAARDREAVVSLLSDAMHAVLHPTGAVLGRQETVEWWRLFFEEDRDGVFRAEPVAVLGESLALCRQSWTGTASVGPVFEVGPYSSDAFALIEADAQGRIERSEVFAADRLGDAVVRLYERYAELLPEGPDRTRASVIARAVASNIGPIQIEGFAFCAADVELVDRRTIGFGSVRGADAFLQVHRSLLEASPDATNRVDDVLGVRAHALLVRMTNLGTDRSTGGAFERHLLRLRIWGADGLVTRVEHFDVDQEAEALARFDELAADLPAPPPVQRRVRANAATAMAARFCAAFANRDVDSLLALAADGVQFIDHSTHADFDRPGLLATWRSLLSVEDLTYRLDPLASLGTSALCRCRLSASGIARSDFDVGAYEIETLNLIDVDADGRLAWIELFSPEHLGEAIARLYALHAESILAGDEHDRAATAARSVESMLGPLDVDRGRAALSPSLEALDHRILGFGSARGANEMLRATAARLELETNFSARIDEILELRSDAFLVRRTNSATDRRSGGALERSYLLLIVIGSDGRVSRWEQFDSERDIEALARFDELTSAPQPLRPARRRVRANAATANAARFGAAIAARDRVACGEVFSDPTETLNHPNGATYDREGILTSLEGAMVSSREFELREVPLASLGESLALLRHSIAAAGFSGDRFDVGAFEREEINLIEVDAHGRRWRSELFAAERLGDAVARLYERYAELLPDGSERTRAAAIARSVATLPLVPRPGDPPDAIALAPDVEFIDHRTVGVGSVHGAEAVLRAFRALRELTETWAVRVDDVLGLRADALLVRWTNCGTLRAGGGAYEQPLLQLYVFGDHGLVVRQEHFDPEQQAEALARFDALASAPLALQPVRRRVRPNAATAHAARVDAAIAARDVDALLSMSSDDMELMDHINLLTWDPQSVRASWRALALAEDPSCRHEPLASLGDSLALCLVSWSASGLASGAFDVGAYEMTGIALIEVDAQGRRCWQESFAIDKLADALARLYERHAGRLPEGTERERSAAIARSFAVQYGRLDLEHFLSVLAPHVDYVDHRSLVTVGSVHGVDAFREVLRTLYEIADDIANRADDVLDARSDAVLMRVTNLGTDHVSGGSYERPFLGLSVFGSDGRITHLEQFDVGEEAAALARLDELTNAVSRRSAFANAATQFFDEFIRCQQARDWEGIVAIHAPGARLIDRRRIIGVDTAGSRYLANLRIVFDMGFSRWRSNVVATRGERLALFHCAVEREDTTAGTAVVEYIGVAEVDARGRNIENVAFDPDDLDAAYAELDARFAAGEGAPHAELLANLRAYLQAFGARDDDAVRRLLPGDLTVFDHRRLVGTGAPVGRDAWFFSWRNLGELGELLARDRVDHIPKLSASAGVLVVTMSGTFGGGEFERVNVVVFTHDGSRPRSLELFDLEQLDAALERYGELQPDPLRIPPNTASRVWDRLDAYAEARDWDGVRALCAPIAYEDRRPLFRVSGDVDVFVANTRHIFGLGVRLLRSPLASLGERLALQSGLWRLTEDGQISEVETIELLESDAQGNVVAILVFGPEARAAASAELFERYARSGGDGSPAALVEFMRAWNEHDLERMRAVLPKEFFFRDHRRTGIGRTDSRDAYLESLVALFELSSDVRLDPIYVIGAAPHGRVDALRWFGTNAEGGDLDAVFIRLSLHRGERLVGIELFEIDDLDAALARFAELCAEAEARESISV